MLSDIVNVGTTDYSYMVRIVDSTDGFTPETAFAFNSAGIDLWYRRPGAAHTSITEVTQTEAGAHTDGGFVHVSDGYYRLDLPDAALASGANYVDVGGTITGGIVIGGRIVLSEAAADVASVVMAFLLSGETGAGTLSKAVADIESAAANIQSRLPAALNNGVMPSDTQRVNDVEIVGDGSSGDKFRAA